MSVYIQLFHGRDTPTEEMPDWGYDGPVLGPLPFFHVTYNCDHKVIRDDSEDWVGSLFFEPDGCVYYDGKWYGDYSIISADLVEKRPEIKARVELPTKDKLIPPDKYKPETPSIMTPPMLQPLPPKALPANDALDAQSICLQRGFRRPQSVPKFTKPDPRGADYGRFDVFFSEGGSGVSVTYRGGVENSGDYNMLFLTPKDFNNWALNCA